MLVEVGGAVVGLMGPGGAAAPAPVLAGRGALLATAGVRLVVGVTVVLERGGAVDVAVVDVGVLGAVLEVGADEVVVVMLGSALVGSGAGVVVGSSWAVAVPTTTKKIASTAATKTRKATRLGSIGQRRFTAAIRCGRRGP